jgi:hypothetical protein
VVSSIAGQPPLPSVATLVHVCCMFAALVVFQLFLEKKDESSVVASVCALLFVFVAVVIASGMAVQVGKQSLLGKNLSFYFGFYFLFFLQNVSFATRFSEEIEKPLINGSHLFVDCVVNGTTMILVVGDIDHSSVYYMPLQVFKHKQKKHKKTFFPTIIRLFFS